MDPDMDETAPSPVEEPVNLRFLRVLVTVLTGTMIAGLLVIIGLLVIRFIAEPDVLALPEALTLPDGTTATAFTQAPGWFAIVTKDNQILIYDRNTGLLRQTLQVTD